MKQIQVCRGRILFEDVPPPSFLFCCSGKHVLLVNQNSLVATALEKLFCGHQATKLRVPLFQSRRLKASL